ncbi:MAG: chemotaxis protein CheZ [Rhodospirillales bacterium]|nr:MAG: chemotaxis protein CheZ [Rhodospirillales bacterium]
MAIPAEAAASGGNQPSQTGKGKTMQSEDLSRFVEELITSLKDNRTPPIRSLLLALRGISMYIRKVETELAAALPDSLKNQHIPAAADELAAIVDATAQATNTIMDAAEDMQRLAGALEPEQQATVLEATTRIFEACAFQDITGQRVTKVCEALRYIEEKMDAIVGIMGSALISPEAEVDSQQAVERTPVRELCNGPQLPGLAKSQAEIDALFEGIG